jgi:hypothetical protein
LNLTFEVPEALVPKFSSKPDEASKIMSEMDDAVGNGSDLHQAG